MAYLDPLRRIKHAWLRYLGRWDLKRAAKTADLVTLKRMRKRLGIQLSGEELAVVAQTILDRSQPRVLVFGTGKDSEFWYRVNRHGQTVFLEDDLDWIERAARIVPHLRILPVTYGTSVANWESFLDDPSRWNQGRPAALDEEPWDVVLVDGPRGDTPEMPGRMKSIQWASELVALGGDIFVHDCNRHIESACCDFFLSSFQRLDAPGRLRHYRRIAL